VKYFQFGICELKERIELIIERKKMKKILIISVAILLLSPISRAATTVDNNKPVFNPGSGGNVITNYNPQLEITFPHYLDVTPMQITFDGTNYYANNGGIYSRGEVRTYDINGNLLNAVLTGLDTRGFFYNPNDGLFYIKDYYGPSLYTVDPATGDTTLVYSGIFHGNQGCLAFIPSTGYMYEMDYGTVYEMELSTGNTLRTLTGFTGNYSLATNGDHLFSYTGSTVYAYDFDGNFVEDFFLGDGNFYTLSFCNDLMWYADGGYGNGNYYGFSGVEGTRPVCEIDMVPDDPPVVVNPGGSFTYTGILTNNSDENQVMDVAVYLDVPDYGRYGPLMRYNNVRLSPYQTITVDNIVQEVPGYAPLGEYEYQAYCGEFPHTPIDSASFDFTVAAPVKGNADNWDLSGWIEGNHQPVDYRLLSNYPNPFNAATIISFDLPAPDEVKLEVYNLLGQKMATLVDRWREAGHHAVNWDASSYSSGIYFYRLTTGSKVFTKRMTLLK
jgi:hypothetical protein